MDVIINTECPTVPDNVQLLTSEGQAVLNLLVSLGYDPLNPPLGDLLRSTHNLEGDWIVLSPIHWQAGHNDAMIIATGDDLQLSEDESKSWFELLFNYFHEDGMVSYYHDANTWLLHVDNKPPLNAKSVYKIIHQSLMPELAVLDSSMYWQKLFTECQMFFASQTNTTALNGVWAWGGAKLTAKKSMTICADEQFIDMARVCSDHVSLYDPSIRLDDFQIILITEFSVLSLEHQQELLKIPAHWYWNNTAYAYYKPNWFTRIWRSLTHAH